MDKPFAAYKGDEPYVFVCYAHDDRGVVYPEIGWLHEQGINLWYDEGISAGKNWRAAIGDSLLGASHVVFYISERSLASDHCNREINLALDEGKDIVPVYLESVELTSDLKVGLTRVQALYRNQDANYQQHLLSALGKTVEETSDKPEPVPSGEPERRQLTVMYCNLADSTQLASQLDPEDYREVVRAYQSLCADVIQRYDGHIAQYLSDGVVVYFGWPQAHEDDADRAVRAGLDLVELDISHPATTVHVGVGIHTGLAVIGGVSSDDPTGQLALGETPNVASRLREIAEPNTVALSESTHRLVEGQFEVEALSNVAGLPVSAVRVLSVRDRSRFEAAHGAHLTPLVGRVEELGMLRHRWSLAKEGEGQVVLLSGQPGIGKSRIAQEFIDEVAGESPILVSLQCSPYHTQSAFYPMIRFLLARLALASEDDDPARLDKLAQWLSANTDEEPTTLHLIADLLSIASDPLEWTREKRKAETVAALIRLVVNQSTDVPILVVLEDAHWIDPSTEELFDEVVDRLQSLRILMVVTHRPEFQSSWSDHGHASQHSLNRLGRREAAEIVSMVAREELPESILNEIVAKTDGIPLFVEELTKAVLEAGLAEGRKSHGVVGSTVMIPATLHDSLMARLDRLDSAKEIAQIGACISREFSYQLIAALAPNDTPSLVEALDRLTDAELLYRRGRPPDATYSFKHALVQATAYQSLLKRRRKEIHSQIADVLLEQFGEVVEVEPELLGHHYSEAGRVELAITYWMRAGQQAAQRAANVEAIQYFRRALSLLDTLPEDRARDATELNVLTHLGPALMLTKGWAAQEVGTVYERANELASRLEGSADLVPPLVGIWLFHNARGRYDLADAVTKQLFHVARSTSDEDALLQAHHAGWPILLFRGAFESASDHIEKGLDIYDYERHKHHALLYMGHDPAVCAHACGTQAVWALGFPDRAELHGVQAIELARRVVHAPTLAFALWYVSSGHAARGDAEAVLAVMEELLPLSQEQKLVPFEASAHLLGGWALAAIGSVEDGLERMRVGFDIWNGTGNRTWLHVFTCLYGDSLLRGRRLPEALEALNRALEIGLQTGERRWESRIHHLRGEALLYSGDADSAVESLQMAIQVARTQQAKSWELRAATRLAMLWAEEGKREDSLDLLAPVYGWFTEGFDTADLKEAKALLEELS